LELHGQPVAHGLPFQFRFFRHKKSSGNLAVNDQLSAGQGLTVDG